MNPIIEAIHEQRKGHYLHALEVSTAYEAEEAIHQLYQEFKGVYLLIDIKDFFNTLEVYYFDEDTDIEEEERVNDFRPVDYLEKYLID